MEVFYWEKAFHPGKKSGKMTLHPQKNFPVMPLASASKVYFAKIKLLLAKIEIKTYLKLKFLSQENAV